MAAGTLTLSGSGITWNLWGKRGVREMGVHGLLCAPRHEAFISGGLEVVQWDGQGSGLLCPVLRHNLSTELGAHAEH